MGGLQFEANLGKKLVRLCLKKKSSIVAYAYNPNDEKGRGRRILIQG
jgi:hypothetical protein